MHTGQYKSTKLYVITALFIALIFIVTAYILHIPMPATGGYIHLGDAFVYLAASMLPTPFAAAAGGFGEALSDILTGSVIYALPTFLIKSTMTLCFCATGKNMITKRNILAAMIAGVICIAGYYLTEAALFRNFTTPLVEVPANLIQAAASAAIYIIVGKVFDNLNIRKRMGAFNS
ncbi:MAG: TIGR04002 family protein [Clostridia bacterium]|nr:TIGR04002 family protein [Clostridia bacterium]